MSAVELMDLVVRYGERVAVDGISFTAEAGAVTALLGPNGAGKTTTVETLEGYRRPASGSARVLGLDPVADHSRLVAQIGVMLQDGGVYPALGAREAIALFASYYPDPEDPLTLVDRLGLEAVASTPWRRLSGGEQQRLSLALALVGRPAVAFLDEPTAGVDPAGRITIREVIRELRDRGSCVVLTTHELDEAERLADQVVIVDRGRVVASGTPADLMTAAPGDDIRFAAPPDLDVNGLSQSMGAVVVETSPGEYRVGCPPTPSAVAALTRWLADMNLPIADLRAGRRRLEDVFLDLTGGDQPRGRDGECSESTAQPLAGRRQRRRR